MSVSVRVGVRETRNSGCCWTCYFLRCLHILKNTLKINEPELHFCEHDPSKSEKFYCGSCSFNLFQTHEKLSLRRRVPLIGQYKTCGNAMTTTTQEMGTKFEVAQHHQSLQSRCDGPVSPIRLMFSTFFETEQSRHCFHLVQPMHAYTVEYSRLMSRMRDLVA